MLTKFLILFLTLASITSGLAQSVQRTQLYDDAFGAAIDSVVLPSGKRALQTSGLVQIDQLFGRDPQATTWFFIGDQYDADGVGAVGDTVRVEIVAAPTPLNITYPAVDVTTTVTAAVTLNANPERALAELICSDLEADANFVAAQWRCTVASDYSLVFISNELYNEFGARVGCILPAKCFSATATGTTTVTEVYNDIEPRGLATELSRSPNDPRKGVLAISGSVSFTSSTVNNLIADTLKNAGSSDMAINGGAGTAFEFLADATNVDNFIIEKVSCYCQGNGIQFGKFCSINSPLTNGVEFSFISEGVTTIFSNVKSTDDFKHFFVLGDPTQFGLNIQSGIDDLVATANFEPPIILTAGSGDKVTALVRDNLGTLSGMECRVFGFKRRR